MSRVCVYICVYTITRTCTDSDLYTYVCVYACVFAFLCKCIYIYDVHTYINQYIDSHTLDTHAHTCTKTQKFISLHLYANFIS